MNLVKKQKFITRSSPPEKIPLRNRKGAVLAMFVGGLVTFIGMMALTIDLGMVYWNESVYTRGVNSIALAGSLVKTVDDEAKSTDGTAKLTAELMANANNLRGYDIDDCTVDPFNNNNRLVRVRSRIKSPVFFSSMFGFDGFNVDCQAYALSSGSGAYIVTDKFTDDTDLPSGYLPMFLYHGNLRKIVRKDGIDDDSLCSAASEAKLASYICTAGTCFSPGDKIWIKSGNKTLQSIYRFVRHDYGANDSTSIYQFNGLEDVLIGDEATRCAGAVDLPFGAIPDTGERYRRFVKHLSNMKPGEPGDYLYPLNDRGENWIGWEGGPDDQGGPPDGSYDKCLRSRLDEDAGSTINNHKAYSARMCIVPICTAGVSNSSIQYGTSVPYLASLPYLYKMKVDTGGGEVKSVVKIIGYAKIWLDQYQRRQTTAPNGGRSRGVVQAWFVDYIGVPPNGQAPG